MTPPRMMNVCTPRIVVSPAASSLRKGARPQGDAEPDAHQQHEGDEDGGGAQQAELLADGGEDEVGGGVGDPVRAAQAEAGAGEPAGAEGEEGLDELEALVRRRSARG